MVKHFLPAGIAMFVATDEMWESPAEPEEEASLARAVPRRRREFRAGRHAARAALRRLGYREQAVIPRGETRAPLWPATIVGSISHTAGRCIAAVAYRRDYDGLGIDVELRSALDASMLPRICTPPERNWIDQQRRSGDGFPWCKLLFSVKEAVYKAFHPIHGVNLDFLEVDIAPDRLAEGNVVARISQTSNAIECVLHGGYQADDNFLYCAVWSPRELQTPPPA